MGIFKNHTRPIVYFSKCVGNKVLRFGSKEVLGKLKDFFVEFEEVYPTVLAIQIQTAKNEFCYVEWDDIFEFNENNIVLLKSATIHQSKTYLRETFPRVVTNILAGQIKKEGQRYPPIGRVVLDRQIVDTSGKKVVRVNDINLLKIAGKLKVTHAGVGLRSLIRRLEYDVIFDFFLRPFGKEGHKISSESLISWKFVHAIPDQNTYENLKLGLHNEELKKIHPADLADILEDLDAYSREQLFSNLDPELAAETLSEMDEDFQALMLRNETPENIAQIIEKMGTDEAADLLNDLEDDMVQDVIQSFQDEEAMEEIQELLKYDEDTAGGLMSTEVLQLGPNTTKTELLKYIQKEYEDLENIYDVYIVDEQERLLGTCSLNKILITNQDLKLKDMMNSHDIKSLSPETKWKEVARYMSKYNLVNVPVIDDHNILLGIISVDDILPWLLDE